MYWLLDISGKISLQCMKVFKRKTQFCMLLTPVFPGRKRGGLKFTDEPTGALDSNSSRMLLTMLTELNERLSATILMVTHDAFSASYCRRILFIKDGKIFHELNRGSDSRKNFFSKILEVVSVLGGEQNDLL